MLQSQPPVPNRILAAVSRLDFERLKMDMERVMLDTEHLLQEAHEPIQYVYFLDDAVVSLLTPAHQSSALAVSLVGNEGVVGVASVLSSDHSAVRAVVQAKGSALRMRANVFVLEFQQNLLLRQAVLYYVHLLLNQIAQTAACNRFHRIEERLARWLLMTRDRTSSDHCFLTHEFLGYLLGIPRAGVTHAAHALKIRHLIDYSRGNIEIISVAGLEAAACACYAKDKRTHNNKA